MFAGKRCEEMTPRDFPYPAGAARTAAELRGRYVMPGRIISFGIVMSSTWTNAVGDTITGKASMQVSPTIAARMASNLSA